MGNNEIKGKGVNFRTLLNMLEKPSAEPDAETLCLPNPKGNKAFVLTSAASLYYSLLALCYLLSSAPSLTKFVQTTGCILYKKKITLTQSNRKFFFLCEPNVNFFN